MYVLVLSIVTKVTVVTIYSDSEHTVSIVTVVTIYYSDSRELK